MKASSWLDDVERTLKFRSNKKIVVFGRFFEHAVTTVGANEIEAARGLALKSVESGGSLREGDDVEIAVVVVVQYCWQIHANADHWQVACAVSKIKFCRQGDGVWVK